MQKRILATESGYALVFTRDLSASVERVWEMLTTRSARADWLFDGTIEPGLGGLVDLYDSHHTVRGRVTAWRPPHLLALTWSSTDAPAGEVRFELSESSRGGCHLRVVHTTGSDARPRSLAAGWHAMLDRLFVAVGMTEVESLCSFDELVQDYLDVPIDRPDHS